MGRENKILDTYICTYSKECTPPRHTISVYLRKFCFWMLSSAVCGYDKNKPKPQREPFPHAFFICFPRNNDKIAWHIEHHCLFCRQCWKALIKKKYAYITEHTQKCMWIQGYWIQGGCSNISPTVHYLYSRFLKWHCNLMMHQPIILSSRTNILAFSL